MRFPICPYWSSARRPQLLIAATLVTVVVFVLPLTVEAKFGEIAKPQFKGRVLGHPNTEVVMRKRGRFGKKDVARFEVRNLPLRCDDGSVDRIVMGNNNIDYVKPRTFYLRIDYVHPDTEDFDVFEVRGHFNRSFRSAKGFLKYDYYNGGSSTHPNCSTRGRMRWRAVEVRR